MTLANVLTTLGALLLGGLVVETLGRRLPLPRVTLLLLFGCAIGPVGLDLLPHAAAERWFEPVTRIALVMVGFLVGERFSLEALRRYGRVVLTLALTNVLGAALFTAVGLLVIGAPPALALLLAGLAGASDPAATYDVVTEDRAGGPFSETLLGIVGIDDAWGLLVFSLAVTVVGGMLSGGTAGDMVPQAVHEIGGAILLGGILGVAAGMLTHRINPGEPTLLEAIGIVLLTAGLADAFDVSYILAAMVLGTVMVNTGPVHNRAFHEIEHLEWPFMVLFFVLSGASLELDALLQVGLIGLAYVLLRTLGLVAGAGAGAWLARAPRPVRRWMGLALLPQAGVALGMALVIQQRFPEIGATILPLAIASTVVFELVGPVMTRLTLGLAGESGRGAAGPSEH